MMILTNDKCFLTKELTTNVLPESLAPHVLPGMLQARPKDIDEDVMLQYRVCGQITINKLNAACGSLCILPVEFRPDYFYFSLVNGNSFIIQPDSGGAVKMNAGQMMLTSWRQKANILMQSGECDIFLLGIPKEYLSALALQYAEICWLMSYEPFGVLKDNDLCSMCISEAVCALYKKVLSFLHLSHASDSELCRWMSRIIVLYATDLQSALGHIQSPTGAGSFYDNLVSFVKANLHREITIEMMANVMHMSETSFKNKCQQYCGDSPAQFVLNYKLELAELYLVQFPGLTIGEIAWEAGFLSHSHFSREFKRRANCTPQEHRASHLPSMA